METYVRDEDHDKLLILFIAIRDVYGTSCRLDPSFIINAGGGDTGDTGDPASSSLFCFRLTSSIYLKLLKSR